MANESPPELDEHARNLLSDARSAKNNMLDVIDRYEQAIWNAAWDRGYTQGWREGYDRAFAVMDQIRQQAQVHSPVVSQTPPRPDPVEVPLMEEDGPSSQDVVLNIIASSPGFRGVEIVAEAAKGKFPVKERTVRTALHRLKGAGKIVSVAERWYMPGDAPRNAEGELY